MRFVQYFLKSSPAQRQLGIRIGEKIVNIETVIGKKFDSLVDFIASGEVIREDQEIKTDGGLNLNEVNLLAPITRPDKVICAGMNYRDHCEEQGVPVPVEPIFFNKFPSTLIGPFDSLQYPHGLTEQLDYEVELAFIIGKKGRNISQQDSMSHVFGYTVAHDVSARELQFSKNGGQWLLGKSIDGFCPIGPEVVTANEIPNPHDLKIMCRVNGGTKQNSNTSQIVHKIDSLVVYLSKYFTLLPGDVILTGTPPGVGCFHKPPFFLKVGDEVECEIENIGTIKNKIV